MLQLDRIPVEKDIFIEVSQNALAEMPKNTAEQVTKEYQMQINKHNNHNNIIQPNSHDGDFVFVCCAQNRCHELNFKCLGPQRIFTAYSKLVYV